MAIWNLGCQISQKQVTKRFFKKSNKGCNICANQQWCVEFNNTQFFSNPIKIKGLMRRLLFIQRNMICQKGNCYIILTFLDILKLAKNLLPFSWGRTWFSILANKQNSWIMIVFGSNKCDTLIIYLFWAQTPENILWEFKDTLLIIVNIIVNIYVNCTCIWLMYPLDSLNICNSVYNICQLRMIKM